MIMIMIIIIDIIIYNILLERKREKKFKENLWYFNLLIKYCNY